MTVQDTGILAIIDRIADHYRENIDNQFLRSLLLGLRLDQQDRERIDEFVSGLRFHYLPGWTLEEMYQHQLSMARFISRARKDIVPHVKQNTARGISGSDPMSNLLRNMTINNLDSNLGILSDSLNELYIKTVSYDEEVSAAPVHLSVEGLAEIGRLLVVSR